MSLHEADGSAPAGLGPQPGVPQPRPSAETGPAWAAQPARWPQPPPSRGGWGGFWAGFAAGVAATLLFGGLVLVAVVIAGVSAGSTSSSPVASSPFRSSTYTLNGALTLAATSSYGSANYTASSGTCRGTSGYNDMSEGAGVTVYSAQGTVVGTGQLRNGIVTNEGCMFAFSVPGVPDDGGIVQVEVSHRGRVSLQPSDAKSGNAAFTLGGN